MTKLLLFLLLSSTILANLTSEKEENLEFTAWKAKHGKKFHSSEDTYREFIFKRNVAAINAHNSNPKHTYKMGQNKFTASTNEQLKANYLGLLQKQDEEKQVKKVHHHKSSRHDPIVTSGSKNWATDLSVNNARDQGQCGSCWSFAVLGAIEFGLKKNKNVDTLLSTQQLVSCDSRNYGCSGGYLDYALEYTMNNWVVTQSAYPYTANNAACNIPSSNEKYKIKNYLDTWYHYGGCANLDALLENNGPAVIAIDVYGGFFGYSSGVYTCLGQTTYYGGHAMVAIGYNPNSYLIQNSWGTSWGQNGDVQITKDFNNNCRLCRFNSYVPTV